VNPEQWERVRDAFEAVVDQAPADAGAWVEAHVGDDAIVKAEVLSLLEHHSRAGSFLAEPIVLRASDLVAADEALPPGALVGPYAIVREIGRGGMGCVYLATDQRLGRAVALKALAPELTRDVVQRERLRREARAAASLAHPGICTVYALEEIGDDLFIASEYIEGHTLRHEIATGARPSPRDIDRVTRELAHALASAHAKGITHRDLKPENVMHANDGRLKILDFGLARIESPMDTDGAGRTAPGVLIGTPSYMAPEQLTGGNVDARADVFAFGVLLYEWLTGVHPFEGSAPLATIARILEGTPAPLDTVRSDVPPAVSDIVHRCLEKSAARRFRSAADVVDELNRGAAASVGSLSAGRIWWRVHQLVVIALYVVAAARAWQIKQWFRVPPTMWIFVVLGIAAMAGGTLRGHLIFTDVMNPKRFRDEWQRTRLAVVAIDLIVAAGLIAAALWIVSAEPLAAVLTMSLALGIALAVLLMEPVTTVSTFGPQLSKD
jgi:predicted Ser/Thr protein kinase